MKKLFIALVVSLLFAEGMFAQSTSSSPKVLTLSKAVEVALDQNVTVKQAQNNLERDQAGVTAAYGRFLPTLSVSSRWGYSKGESFLPDGQKLPTSAVQSLSSSVDAGITLFDGFFNTSNLSQSTSTAVATEYNLSRTRQTVVHNARSLYYNVLRTRRLLEVAEATVKYDNQQLERIKETARLGSASLVNVYQQQAQGGQDEVALVQAQSNYENAIANLIAYLGLDVAENYIIEDASIPEDIKNLDANAGKQRMQDFRAMANQALNTRFDYQSAKESFNAADVGVTGARSGYFPTITAGTSYGLNGNNKFVSEFEDLKNNRSFNWSLSFSLPIFSGFRTNQAEQSALVAKKNAEVGLYDKQRTIQVEVRSALLQLESAERIYEAAVKSLQFQDQNLKVNQEKYNVGSGTLLDLLLAQNNYNSALTSKINAVFQYQTAKSNLELALGTIQQ